jgi:hypothetical protein
MEREEKIYEIEAHGSFVKKTAVKKALNIKSKLHWSEEILLLCTQKPAFQKAYLPYLYHQKIPIPLARTILETIIIENSGEEDAIIKFVRK